MDLSAGVFGHKGLGDGVNCLVLSNNLYLNGWKVDTYQNVLGSMQNWFPHLPILPYPTLDELPRILNTYDFFFVVHSDTDPFVLRLIQEGKRRFPDRFKIIYLYPSNRIVSEPYYADCLTDPGLSIAENMRLFCERILHLPKITHRNGFIPPPGLISRKFQTRVVIHPTSSRTTRNWPKEKFIKLANYVKERGYEPVFVPGTREGWDHVGIEVALFPSLDLLASYLYESAFLIGNDSGLGHLASAVGVSTLTICRRKAWAKMWAPSFHKSIVLTPSSLIPNIRGLRWRDRYWKQFITIAMAKKAFEQLLEIDTVGGSVQR